jgi:8-oxo-dGTP pyrophosphatase MutT (NUDIX family)
MQLAQTADKAVRLELARNPSCPPQALAHLADAEVWRMHMAVITHRSTPAATIAHLTISTNSRVSTAAFKHPQCPPAVLESNCYYPRETVRAAVAKNPRCPIVTLQELILDPYLEVRRAVVHNLRCSTSLLQHLSRDPEWGCAWQYRQQHGQHLVLPDRPRAASVGGAHNDLADKPSRALTHDTKEPMRRRRGSNQYRTKLAPEITSDDLDLIQHAGAASGRLLVVPGAQLLATFTTLRWLPPGSRARLFASTEFPTGVQCSTSAGLITDDRGYLLLVRVIDRGWDIPGGHPDEGESPLATLVRESFEESGTEVHDLKPVGYLTTEKQHEPPAFIAFYSGKAEGAPQPHPDWTHEVDQAAWVAPDKVLETPGHRVWVPMWLYLQQH